jgi:hypothetical protein
MKRIVAWSLNVVWQDDKTGKETDEVFTSLPRGAENEISYILDELEADAYKPDEEDEE